MRTAGKFAIVALIAAAFVAIPGGGNTLNVIVTALTLAFFTAIGMFGYRLYREQRFLLESLDDRMRLVLYGSIGLAFLTFAASRRLFDTGGGGVLVWLALLGLASYGAYWVYARYRSYE
jgi:hypothetical protein